MVIQRLFKKGFTDLKHGDEATFHSVPRKNVYLVYVQRLAKFFCVPPAFLRATFGTQDLPEPDRDDVEDAMHFFDALQRRDAAEASRTRRIEKARYERASAKQVPNSSARCDSVLDGDSSQRCSCRKVQGSEFCVYHQDRPNFAIRIGEYFEERKQAATPVTEESFYSWVKRAFPHAKHDFSPIHDFPKFMASKAGSRG